MPRVLLLATTTGYQTRAFGDAAERLGVTLVFATDRCHMLEDPWRDGAVAIRFHDEEASVEAIVDAARVTSIDGLITVGDRPTVIAARAAERLGLTSHPADGARTAHDKQRTRERLRDAGLPVPWFVPARIAADARALASTLEYPCVIKPVALSGSRGVMRADDPEQLAVAFSRLRTLLQSPDIRAERSEAHDRACSRALSRPRVRARRPAGHGAPSSSRSSTSPDPLTVRSFEGNHLRDASALADRDQARVVGYGRPRRGGDRPRPRTDPRRMLESTTRVFVLEVAAARLAGCVPARFR